MPRFIPMVSERGEKRKREGISMKAHTQNVEVSSRQVTGNRYFASTFRHIRHRRKAQTPKGWIRGQLALACG